MNGDYQSLLKKEFLYLVLRFLDSNSFKGPFKYGLSQETPPGWNPYHDYSLIYGYHEYYPMKTKELLEDASLPFSQMEKFQILSNPKWFELRVGILVSEILNSIEDSFTLGGQNEVSRPEEWRNNTSGKLYPLIYTRFHFLRLLRALYYYGLDLRMSLLDNFQFLYSKCSLEDYDEETSILFLSNIYNRCKNVEKSLHFPIIEDISDFDTFWVSDEHISSLCEMLLLLQTVRELSQLDDDLLRSRFECCPPWTAALQIWNVEKDFFMFKLVSQFGFSSLVQFYVDENSPIIEKHEITQELINLRHLEELQVAPLVNLRFNKCRFLFRHDTRFLRIKQLVEILVCPHFEYILLMNPRNSLTILNTGIPNKSKALLGYFALRMMLNEKGQPFLFSCSVGGSISQPIYQINVREKYHLKVHHMQVEEVLKRFKAAAADDPDLPKIPEEMTGSQFFGFDEPVTTSIISQL
ncbi:hypothetical protein TRFO_03302 [Tritrichomonas foetus]|uniref:Uncharacterized protein n=1 Tax=Tritrichomonas foetus TaxID=1144522 RepID=A0A1J4KUZ3_9EUKA|nr:hypothetical protein TRFO_03302 [Tritrichomonas foetus]|eukprot:OHT13556.1 hypothetical protein TRFO_03302 [Tritrichomonas foetus]